MRLPRSGHPAYYASWLMRQHDFPEAGVWYEVLVHDFKNGDERLRVVQTCQRYVALLEGLIAEAQAVGSA
jgi:hypothetical protein